MKLYKNRPICTNQTIFTKYYTIRKRLEKVIMNNTDFKSTFSLLNVDYVRLNKNWNYRNVISPFYRIYLIDDGYGSLGNGDEGLTLEKGYLYLIPSFTMCDHHCPESLGQFYAHIIEETIDGQGLLAAVKEIRKIPSQPSDFEYFQRLLQLNPGRGLRRSDNPHDYGKQLTLNSFRERNNFMSLSAYIETKGLMMMLLSRFLVSSPQHPGAGQKIPAKIVDAMNFMQVNLHETITVEMLAFRAGLNVNYFSRLFLRYTGMRPLVFLQVARVKRAQLLIVTAGLSLSEIATETGFESLSYFSHIFKKITGQPASRYKALNGIV